MKTIITGANGFIGSYIKSKVASMGHEITTIDHHQIYRHKYTNFDYFFFVSAYGNHYHQEDDVLTYEANLEQLRYILDEVKNMNFRAFVHFSTSSVTLKTQTMYSATKHAAEKLCQGYAEKYSLPIYSVRPYSVYGPGEAAFRFIPTMVRSIKEGEQIKLAYGYHDWIYINDLVDGVIATLPYAKKLAGYAIPIGTGTETGNAEVLSDIARIMDTNITKLNIKSEGMRTFDTDHWVADTTIIDFLGWKPKYSLYQGLEKTVRYYEK